MSAEVLLPDRRASVTATRAGVVIRYTALTGELPAGEPRQRTLTSAAQVQRFVATGPLRRAVAEAWSQVEAMGLGPKAPASAHKLLDALLAKLRGAGWVGAGAARGGMPHHKWEQVRPLLMAHAGVEVQGVGKRTEYRLTVTP